MLKVTGSQVVNKARSYKGKYAKSCNKFTKYFKGKYDVSKSGKLPNGLGYCTMFCGYVLAQLGAFDAIPHTKVKRWWHTQKLLAWYKKNKKSWVVTNPLDAKAGALAFKKCGSTKKKSTGHTSIFVKYDGKYVHTIDGNVGGGVVERKKTKDWYVAFVNLPYAQQYKVVTSGGNLNRRDANGKIIGKIANGTVVNVYEIKDGWAYLTDGGVCSIKFLKKV